MSLTVVRQQVFHQLVALVLEDIPQIRCHLLGDGLDVRVQFTQVVRQPDELVQRSHFQVGEVQLVILAQVVLLAGDIVHGLPRLLAGLVARC